MSLNHVIRLLHSCKGVIRARGKLELAIALLILLLLLVKLFSYISQPNEKTKVNRRPLVRLCVRNTDLV